jgi:uncharacterized membrane protein HdeD (DUF308 family)
MHQLARMFWSWFLIRGIIAVLIGLLALFMPAATFTALVMLLGVFMLVTGLFTIITAIAQRDVYENWGWLLASGIVSAGIGILTFVYPMATGVALIYLVAFWALLMGIAEIAIAIQLRREITGEGWFIAAGVLSVLFALLILFYPIAGAYTLTVIFGIYALIAGVTLLTVAFRLRNIGRQARGKRIPVT